MPGVNAGSPGKPESKEGDIDGSSEGTPDSDGFAEDISLGGIANVGFAVAVGPRDGSIDVEGLFDVVGRFEGMADGSREERPSNACFKIVGRTMSPAAGIAIV